MPTPTKYKKQYCQELVEHMRDGYSFHSFAGKIGVGARTLFDWLDKYPDFQDAKDQGEHACLLFWEKTGIAGMFGKTFKNRDGKEFKVNVNPAIWIFNMKARFAKHGWRDIPEDPDKLKASDRTDLARQLLSNLSQIIRDQPCQDMNSQPQSSVAPCSSGLLGESKNPS